MDFGLIREIEGDTVLSPSLPRLGIRFSSDFIYLGDLQFIADETFHVEQFIFISPNGLGHVTRLLLIHFAGYLENKEGTFDYPPQPTIRMDGEEYRHEVRLIDINEHLEQFPASELTHAADYIRQRAYTLAGDMVYHRFSRLVSDNQRNEFIISYLERSEDAQRTAELLRRDENYARALQERAQTSFTIIH